MPHLTDEEVLEARVTKLEQWLEVIDEHERDLEKMVLSRAQEHAGQAGVDPDPRLRPCEHRPQWQWGRLCLACDNGGLRRATEKEREEGLAYDPYLLDPPRDHYAVTRDQSFASEQARRMTMLDASIEAIKRELDNLWGTDVIESGSVRVMRQVEALERSLGRDGAKVLRALRWTQEAQPATYHAARQRKRWALEQLSRYIAGSLRSPD